MSNGRTGKKDRTGSGAERGGADSPGGEGVVFAGTGRESDSSGASAFEHGHEHSFGGGSGADSGGEVLGGGNGSGAASNRPEGGERGKSSAVPPPPVIELPPEASFSESEAPSFEVTEEFAEPPLSKYQQRKRRREERERLASLELNTVTSTFDAEVTASMIIDTLSNFAGALVDERACMTDSERNSMKDPLARSITRFQPSLASALSKYADPVALIIAFGLWANRVRVLRTERVPAQSIHSAPDPETVESDTQAIPYDESTGNTEIPNIIHQYMRSPI